MNKSDTNYQRQIIDTFINAIYVFDDKLAFTYNFHDGTETITLKEIEAAFGSDLSQVAPPPKSLEIKVTEKGTLVQEGRRIFFSYK